MKKKFDLAKQEAFLTGVVDQLDEGYGKEMMESVLEVITELREEEDELHLYYDRQYDDSNKMS